jgi:hypothetical protein
MRKLIAIFCNDNGTRTERGHYLLEWSVFTHEFKVLSGRTGFTVSAGTAG